MLGAASGSTTCTRPASNTANSRQPKSCSTTSPTATRGSAEAITSPTAPPDSGCPIWNGAT